ncbi:RecB-like endonuclease [Ralstonia phage UAM5]|nr:RecB-like endonuclease [Ralstonia phage UAM5]
MTIERVTLTPANEADWLAMRAQDLTSTEVAALFGVSPYATEYELFMRKTKRIVAEFKENERMTWGKRLESAIAAGIAEDYGLIVAPFKEYMRLPALRMGASFDFKIVGVVDGARDNEARRMFLRHGPGVMEIKNVDGLQFRRAWIDDGDEIEAPAHIEFQAQAQLEVADLGWSMIAPLVGGNTPKVSLRERDTEVGALIREKVAEFWMRVDAGAAPKPDYTRDGDTIKQLYRDNDGSSVDMSDDPRLAVLCSAYKAAGAEEKAAEGRKKAALAEIVTIIEHAKSIRAAGHNISAGTNKESYRVYDRAASKRYTISVSEIPAATIEATVAPFRNVRITPDKAA